MYINVYSTIAVQAGIKCIGNTNKKKLRTDRFGRHRRRRRFRTQQYTIIILLLSSPPLSLRRALRTRLRRNFTIIIIITHKHRWRDGNTDDYPHPDGTRIRSGCIVRSGDVLAAAGFRL